jgi:hypothetical protein
MDRMMALIARKGSTVFLFPIRAIVGLDRSRVLLTLPLVVDHAERVAALPVSHDPMSPTSAGEVIRVTGMIIGHEWGLLTPVGRS